MSSTEGLLAAVQLADSALPIGRFVHSHGLEAWLRDHAEATESALADLVEAVVCEGVAPLDEADEPGGQRVAWGESWRDRRQFASASL